MIQSVEDQIAGHVRSAVEDAFLPSPPTDLRPAALLHESMARLATAHGFSWRIRPYFALQAVPHIRREIVACSKAGADDSTQSGGTGLDAFDALVRLGVDDAASVRLKDYLLLDVAISDLEAAHRIPGRVAAFALVGGLSQLEIAEVLDRSRSEIASDWTLARAWLERELS